MLHRNFKQVTILLQLREFLILRNYRGIRIFAYFRNTAPFGSTLKDVSELCLHLIMLVVAVLAYYQIRKLDINPHPISLLDDLLLFVCIPAFYMETCFTLVPTAINLSFVKFFNVLFMVRLSYLMFLQNICSSSIRVACIVSIYNFRCCK